MTAITTPGTPRTRTRRALATSLAGVVAAGGAAIGLLPSSADAVRGTAPASAPAPAGQAFGLTANGQLVTFGLRAPGTSRTVGTIRGLSGERLVGIDIRSANRKLYGVSRAGGLFTINPRTARATRVGSLDAPLRGTSFGVDVNPAADALRIISNNGQNLRHAFEGNVTTVDIPLNVPEETPRATGFVGAAYTNNDNDDATGTALFVLNHVSDSVALQVPANNGTITGQGPLGRRTGVQTGFDIKTERTRGQATTNVGYATLGSTGRGYALFKVSVLTGDATKIGAFRRNVVDIATR